MTAQKFSNVSTVELRKIGDKNGYLVALEEQKNIPFEIKRVYYIFGTKPEIVRGHHAHKKLKQMLIAVSGSVTIKCEYDGRKKEYRLNRSDEGLLIEGLVWREMHDFSPDCVLMVLADEYYSEDDYIRDYKEYLKASDG